MINTNRIKDFENLALAEAELSPCKKRKVGAIIVDQEGNVISKGHNFNPKGINCEDHDGQTCKDVIHAEIAALKGTVISKGSTIFVTHKPCENCQAAIDKAGLTVHLVEQFMKFDSGKLRYGLIPPEIPKALAEVLTYGAKKYKPNNWKQVDSNDRYIDALYRHLEAWRSGETHDSESGLHHLAHALTNVGFLLYLEPNMDGRKVSEND